ncbi:MAG TPA: hypothetical protein VNK24_07430 [Elusimicrobiota bacterium]|nr:hypothetical protein [Elusimicrobiota bacterium]
MKKFVVACLGAALAATPVFCAAQRQSSDQWSQLPFTAPSDDVPGGYFTNPERAQLNVVMQKGQLSQICRGLQINVHPWISGRNLGGAQPQVVRSLQLLPDNRLALVDEEGLDVNLSHWFQVARAGGAAFGVTLQAGLQGTSMVVRPTSTQDSCDELKRLVKLTDVKTVLPFKASRLSAMEVGELWKMPFVLTIAHAESLAFPAAAAAAAAQPTSDYSISFGVGQTGSAIMTVYRLSRDQVRFRLRIDHARIMTAQGQIIETVPALQLFSPHGLIKTEINNLAVSELQQYLTANLSILAQKTQGQQMLVEFILDPNNPRQMENLARVMHGDIHELVLMAKRVTTLHSTQAAAMDDYGGLVQGQEDGLDSAYNYDSSDLYKNKQKAFSLMLPFLADWSRSWTRSLDHIVRYGPQGGQFIIYSADKAKNAGYFNIPIKGELVKRNVDSNVQAFVYRPKAGAETEPEAIYIHQEGFLHRSASSVRGTLRGINELMETAGAKGSGVPDTSLAVPYDTALAQLGKKAPGEYHTGTLTLALIFSPKALASILSADAAAIVKSYVATLDGVKKQAMEWLLEHGTVGADGKISFNRFQFDDEWDDYLAVGQGHQTSSQIIQPFCLAAREIVEDIAGVRAQSSPEARAAAFRDILSGRDKSGLAYRDIVRVLVQLVNPMDLTGNLVMNLDAGGHRKLQTQFVLKKGRPADPVLQEAGQAKARYILPSPLVD